MNWLSFVANVQYDLIGRIVPGSAIIAVGCLLFVAPEKFGDIKKTIEGIHASILLLAWIGSSYLIGTLSGAPGFALADLWTFIALKIKPTNNTSYDYDNVVAQLPRHGARLAKLRAERHLCHTLMSGSTCLLFAFVWFRPNAGNKTLVINGLFLSFILSSLVLNHIRLRAKKCLNSGVQMIDKGTKEAS